MHIENSIALVTGANRGAGKAYVAELLLRGAAKVYASARNSDSLADTVALDPSRVVPIRLDVIRAEDIAAARAGRIGRHASGKQCGRAQLRRGA